VKQVLYALLIRQAPGVAETRSPEEQEVVLAAHRALQRDAKGAGAFVAATQLGEVDTATTVRRREGRLLVTDGPFAETKELFIGFYLMECADLDEAIALAERLPSVGEGSIEIRPVVYAEANAVAAT